MKTLIFLVLSIVIVDCLKLRVPLLLTKAANAIKSAPSSELTKMQFTEHTYPDIADTKSTDNNDAPLFLDENGNTNIELLKNWYNILAYPFRAEKSKGFKNVEVKFGALYNEENNVYIYYAFVTMMRSSQYVDRRKMRYYVMLSDRFDDSFDEKLADDKKKNKDDPCVDIGFEAVNERIRCARSSTLDKAIYKK